MKKTIPFVVAVVALASACAKEIVPAEDSNVPVDYFRIPMTFTLGVEDTKAILDGPVINWEEGDKIAVWDGVTKNDFSAQSSGPSSVFCGEAGESDSYVAVSPSSCVTNVDDPTTIAVTLKGGVTPQRVSAAHRVDPDALVSSTRFEKGSSGIVLKNQFSLAKITISRSDIQTVTLIGGNGENICGTNGLSKADGETLERNASDAGQVVLKYNGGEGDSAFVPGDYYIALWPTEFSQGLSVKMETGGEHPCVGYKKSDKSVKFVRNGGFDLGTIDSDVQFASAVIMNAEDLKSWASDYERWTADDLFVLGADIDLAGENWTAVPEFAGTLDGQGHSIYNLVVQSGDAHCGFIDTLTGTVKDIVFGSQDGMSWDGVSSITTKYSGSQAVFCAPICYLKGTGARLSGITNFANLQDDPAVASFGADLQISGIVAEAEGKIRACTNHGNISVGSNIGAALYIGGVCGWLATNTDNPMSICTNTGDIICDGFSVNNQIYGGGVLGGEKNSITVTHNGFVNRGRVSFGENAGISRNSNDNECFIGGCVGGNGSTKATYANFENYGDVTYKGLHRVRIGGIASYASKNPSGAVCKANITYKGKNTSKQSYAGGVIGYLNISAISGLSFEGVLDTSGSDQLAYTGGITGYINQTCTMSGCRVGGQVKGVTLSSTGKDVGLLCCTTSSKVINFEGCTVAPGTKRGDTVVQTLVRSHSDCGGDWTRGALCGGAGSTGTVSGCFMGTVSYEDPLTFLDGTPVTQSTWDARRAEIRSIFEENMYGRIPAKSQIYTQKFDSGSTTVTGNTASGSYGAIREQYHMWFKSDHSGPCIDWLVIRPSGSSATNPAKVIFGLIFQGNHNVLPDTQIAIPTCWYDNWSDFYISGNRAQASGRGCMLKSGKRYHYPIDYFLSRGYAFVCATYGEVCCDPELNPGDRPQSDCFETGVFDLWKPRSNSDPTRPMALGAWAWAMMEGMDLVESIPELDDSKVVLTGVSRLGKSCLIAGAFDDRFAVVAPVQTGGGGTPLTKYYLPGKETIASETHNYTHWFIPGYAEFAGHESEMTFDQHLLVSCVAPRAIFALGFDMAHFNSPGEFQSLREASPAWTLWGKEPLPDVPYPDAYSNEAIGANMAYYRRTEASGHGVQMDDWTRLLDFADRNFQ